MLKLPTNLLKLRQLLMTVLMLFMISPAHAEITFPSSVFQNLDTGLYWFGYNDAEKAQPGQANVNFDPTKKTVIYIHGWQNGSSQNQSRETLHRGGSGGPNEDLSWYWLDRGWNVGILYWNQLADEGDVKHAEAKIHTTNGPQGMRWRRTNGSYNNNGPTESVTDILYSSLVSGLQGFSGSELRITGHSLGNQLALTVSAKLVNNNSFTPDRVTLLDPFYSNGAESYYGGKWAGEIARDNVTILKTAGVAIEAYRSSPVTSTVFVGDQNKALMNQTAFVELKPWNFNFWQLAEKHGAAVTHYFWSMAFDPLTLDRSSTTVPSAAVSKSRIQFWMNSNNRLVQDSGAWTGTPADDDFKTAGRL